MEQTKKGSRRLYKKVGFSLIELLIALAIMGLVSSMVYAISGFSLKSMNLTSDKAQKQFEVRMAADAITKQLRYAKDVAIINSIPTPTSGYDDIYLSGNRILFTKNGVANSNGLTNAADLTVSFTKAANNIIRFTVGIAGNSAFDIISEVTILNMPQTSSIVDVTSGTRLGVHFSTTPLPARPMATSLVVGSQGNVNTIITGNGTLQMIATITPSGASTNVNWTVQNGTGKASISGTGLLTALTNGTVTVQAVTTDGSGLTDTKVITLSNQPVQVTSITVKGGTGTGNINYINTNPGTLQMIATVLPSGANQSVDWTVNNASIATISSSSGLLQAISNGTVIVYANAKDYSGVSGSMNVTISTQPIQVTSITVTVNGKHSKRSITSDNGTLQMSAAVLPSNAANRTYTWSTNDSTNATIDPSSGVLKAVTNGIVTVIATANDAAHVKGTLDITISGQIVKVTSIAVRGTGGATAITIPSGVLQMIADVTPYYADDSSVTWTVQNGTGKASINSSSGLLQAMGNGTVTVKATANDGSGKDGTIVITLSNQPILVTSLTVTAEGGVSKITALNGVLQMYAAASPSNATDKTCTWSTSNSLIATISSSGLLQAVSAGTVTVTASANDASGVTETKEITIEPKPKRVSNSYSGNIVTIVFDRTISTAIYSENTTEKTVTIGPLNSSTITVTLSGGPKNKSHVILTVIDSYGGGETFELYFQGSGCTVTPYIIIP